MLKANKRGSGSNASFFHKGHVGESKPIKSAVPVTCRWVLFAMLGNGSWHEDCEQVSSWGFANPALSTLLNWRGTRAEGLPHEMSIWHPWLFIRHESSNTHLDKAIHSGEWCCDPKFQLATTLWHVWLPWREPQWYQWLQNDKGINPGWSTSLLKGFHQPQILTCLDILPQLVHRRTFRWWFLLP